MAKNKVVYDGTVLINLENDTVTQADVTLGVTFHLPSGEVVQGTHECHDIEPEVRYILEEEEF